MDFYEFNEKGVLILLLINLKKNIKRYHKFDYKYY